MGKKWATLFMIACFLVGTATATSAFAKKTGGALDGTLAGLQDSAAALETPEEIAPLVVDTQLLLDALDSVANGGSLGDLAPIIRCYLADLKSIQAQQTVSPCIVTLLMGTYFNVTSMVNIASSNAATNCVVIRLSNKAADIISDIQTYQICEIDNSETPDQEQRDALVQNQVMVETYDFISHLLDVALCDPQPDISDLFSLLADFLGIFPDQPEE